MAKKRNNSANRSFLTEAERTGFSGMVFNGPIKEVDESREITNQSNVFERLNIDAQTIPEKRKGREQAERDRELVDEKTG